VKRHFEDSEFKKIFLANDKSTFFCFIFSTLFQMDSQPVKE
jgi:hypothetical protein